MDRVTGVGGVCTAAGVAGYAVGVLTAYPGRSFSLTALMLGITLLAIGGGEA